MAVKMHVRQPPLRPAEVDMLLIRSHSGHSFRLRCPICPWLSLPRAVSFKFAYLWEGHLLSPEHREACELAPYFDRLQRAILRANTPGLAGIDAPLPAALLAPREAHVPGCTDKARFQSRRAARSTRDSVIATEGKRLRIYRCEACGDYHLTENSGPRSEHVRQTV